MFIPSKGDARVTPGYRCEATKCRSFLTAFVDVLFDRSRGVLTRGPSIFPSANMASKRGANMNMNGRLTVSTRWSTTWRLSS